jgi:hypothetical protein
MSTTKAKKKVKTPQRGRPTGSVNKFGVNLSAVIRETIESRKRFVHQRELVEALTKKVGKSKIADPVEFARKTSVLLYSLKNRKAIAQFSASSSTREKFYGKPEWIKRGKVAPGFAPKES